MVEHLPSKCEALNSNSSSAKNNNNNKTMWEIEQGKGMTAILNE
jgi:hypothetical protein